VETQVHHAPVLIHAEVAAGSHPLSSSARVSALGPHTSAQAWSTNHRWLTHWRRASSGSSWSLWSPLSWRSINLQHSF